MPSPETRAERMLMLQFGAERIPKEMSIGGGGPRLGWEPIIGALVETSAGWVLLETGMGRRALDDPGAQAGYADAAGNPATPPAPAAPFWPEAPADRPYTWGLDGDPLTAALAEHGLAPGDLALAAISHLHIDHTGGLAELAAAGVPVAVQRTELAFARSAAADAAGGYYRPDFERDDIAWRELDGDAELAPGVHALATPGHTPGHMSFRVELERSGSWLLAVDAADLGQNLHDEAPPGILAGTEAEGRASIARLLEEARARRARLVPGHDQLIWNAVRHPDGGHR